VDRPEKRKWGDRSTTLKGEGHHDGVAGGKKTNEQWGGHSRRPEFIARVGKTCPIKEIVRIQTRRVAERRGKA